MSRRTSSRTAQAVPSLTPAACDAGEARGDRGGGRSETNGSSSSSSSSSSGSSSSSNKRTAEQLDRNINCDAGISMDRDTSIFPFANYAGVSRRLPLPIEMNLLPVSEKDKKKFATMTDDAKKSCISIATRLLLFKATKNEQVARSKLLDALKNTMPNQNYSTHASAAVHEAQTVLYNTFGLRVVDGSDIPGVGDDGKDTSKYYVVNTLRTPNLMRLVWDSRDKSDMAYRGVVLCAMHAVFAAPGRKIDRLTLLKRLKQVDRNIPDSEMGQGGTKRSRTATGAGVSSTKSDDDGDDDEEYMTPSSTQRGRADRAIARVDANSHQEYQASSSSSSSSSSSNADGNNGHATGDYKEEERKPKTETRRSLGGRCNLSNYTLTSCGDIDITKAIDRMLKESYLMKEKVDAADVNVSSIKYTFGPRFFAEIGLTRLILSYFDALGTEPVDSIMNDVIKEEKRLRVELAIDQEEDAAENTSGRAAAHKQEG